MRRAAPLEMTVLEADLMSAGIAGLKPGVYILRDRVRTASKLTLNKTWPCKFWTARANPDFHSFS